VSKIYDTSSISLAKHGIARSWSIRVIALLLLVQAIGLIIIIIYESTEVNWQQALGGRMLTGEALDAVLIGSVFAPVAVLSVLAAFSMLRMFRIGWLLAMIVQTITLATCLTLYFQQKPIFVYPLMSLCIILVLYLNSFEVRLAFHVRRSSQQLEARDEY
jgi:hypothetical protein